MPLLPFIFLLKVMGSAKQKSCDMFFHILRTPICFSPFQEITYAHVQVDCVCFESSIGTRETPNARIRKGDSTIKIYSPCPERQCIICSAQNWVTYNHAFLPVLEMLVHDATVLPQFLHLLSIFIHAQKGKSCRAVVTLAENELEVRKGYKDFYYLTFT